MKMILFVLFTLLPGGTFIEPAVAAVDFHQAFGKRDGCFLLSDLSSGKIIQEFNKERCARRVTPCSTFKVAAAVMAFEDGVLKDENQVIKWDGTVHKRSELNQDQTPVTWMSNSVIWVTQWVMPQLGTKRIDKFLGNFDYGNKDFSGGMKHAWVESTLKISAYEQLRFISRLWKDELPVSKRAMELAKKTIFIKKLGPKTELFGKTGSGCIDSGCEDHPARMIGNFIGVVKAGEKEYAVAASADDLEPFRVPAGGRLRDTVISILRSLRYCL